jgi:hypothetical protein
VQNQIFFCKQKNYNYQLAGHLKLCLAKIKGLVWKYLGPQSPFPLCASSGSVVYADCNYFKTYLKNYENFNTYSTYLCALGVGDMRNLYTPEIPEFPRILEYGIWGNSVQFFCNSIYLALGILYFS